MSVRILDEVTIPNVGNLFALKSVRQRKVSCVLAKVFLGAKWLVSSVTLLLYWKLQAEDCLASPEIGRHGAMGWVEGME